jgi:hypothetical protein
MSCIYRTFTIVWKILRPKLEALLNERKLAEAQEAIRCRRAQREREFEPFWDGFVISRSWNTAQPWALPRFVDACELPAINSMLTEDDSKIPVTAERWRLAIMSVPDDLERFASQVMHDVIRLLKTTELRTKDAAAIVDETIGEDPSIFERATSLLSCGTPNCHNLLTFPAILQEEHVTPYRYFNFNDRKWPDLFARLQHEPEVLRSALLVLKTLRLPTDTLISLFNEFDMKFVCLCGNPKFQRPMDFQSLVRKFIEMPFSNF